VLRKSSASSGGSSRSLVFAIAVCADNRLSR
jgi:hypothetical protein